MDITPEMRDIIDWYLDAYGERLRVSILYDFGIEFDENTNWDDCAGSIFLYQSACGEMTHPINIGHFPKNVWSTIDLVKSYIEKRTREIKEK